MLKSFDIFQKLSDNDLRVKTKSGGLISILTALSIAILTFHEFKSFAITSYSDDVVVDTSRIGIGRTMPISFNITVYMPCSKVHVNLYDSDGIPQLTGSEEIHKMRLYENELPIDNKHIKVEPKSAAKGDNNVIGFLYDKNKHYCGKCYGAKDEGECCNSCDDVVNAFKEKGWDLKQMHEWEQCTNEDYQKIGNEFCSVYGYIRVSRNSGTLYFAWDDIKPTSKRYIDISRISASKINYSHHIHRFYFGTALNHIIFPLEGTKVNQKEQGRIAYNYEVEVVPYTLIDSRKFSFNTYSYASTLYRRNLSNSLNRGVPGIFFNYYISPVSVNSYELQRSLWKLFLSLCSIVGGSFAFAYLFDTFTYNTFSSIIEKISMGKYD